MELVQQQQKLCIEQQPSEVGIKETVSHAKNRGIFF